MANTSFIRGAASIGNVGQMHRARVRTYIAVAGNGSNMFIGDIVELEGSAEATGKYKAIKILSNGSTAKPLGFIVGIDPIKGVVVGSENLNRLYRPASTAMYIRVCDDPDALFEMQCTGSLTLANTSLNAGITLGSGNTTSGYSGHVIDSNTVGTTNTYPIQLMGLIDRVDNAIGANAKYICRFNVHQLKVDTGATGI